MLEFGLISLLECFDRMHQVCPIDIVFVYSQSKSSQIRSDRAITIIFNVIPANQDDDQLQDEN